MVREYIVTTKDYEELPTGRGMTYPSSIPGLKDIGRSILIIWGGKPRRILGQLYLVEGTREQIDKIREDAHVNQYFDNAKDAQLFGLKIKTGTPTERYVDDLAARLKKELDLDLSQRTHIDSGKSFEAYLKEDTESYPEADDRFIRPFEILRWIKK